MISPQKAADQAGVSRRTVMVAIENRSLPAHRNNKNHWQISPEDLQRWIDERGTSPDTKPDTSSGTTTETSTDSISIQLVSLKVENADIRARLDAANDKVASLEGHLAKRDADYQSVLNLLTEAQRPKGILDWVRKRLSRE